MEGAIGIFGPSESRMERLGAWFAAEYEPLLRFAYFLTADRETAEDLVQDAFLRVNRSRGRVEDPAFPAYARKTIVNLARSLFRRTATAQRFEMRQRMEAGGDPSEAAASYDLRRALLALPVRQRACLALRFYEDKKEQEIADVLGISNAAVRKQLERAIKRLRASLKEEQVP